MSRDSKSHVASAVAVIYAACVIGIMAMTIWPGANDSVGLAAVLLSLPWGLGVVLALDTINPDLIGTLGPPLVAMCGILNAFLLHNTFRSRGEQS